MAVPGDGLAVLSAPLPRLPPPSLPLPLDSVLLLLVELPPLLQWPPPLSLGMEGPNLPRGGLGPVSPGPVLTLA